MGRDECKLGIWGSASYQQVRGWVARWGDKSGIWKFYRRVWKNIFYERRDKERERGFLGMGGREGGKRIYIFLKIFKGVEKSSKLYRGMYFWVMGWEEKEKKGKGIGFLG